MRLIEGHNNLQNLEYLVLDALFQLLARITPSSSDVTGRANLAKDVFQNAGCKRRFGQKTCNELASLLRSARGDQWEKVRISIIVFLYRHDISVCNRQRTKS